MGWSFRRSVKACSDRVYLSKSGLRISGGVKSSSVSFGGRGARRCARRLTVRTTLPIHSQRRMAI